MNRIKKGFTVIEMLVVMALIAILITVGGFSYSRMMKRVRATEARNDANNIKVIFDNMYKNGIYGHKKRYGNKGYYPSVQAMNSTDLDTDSKTLLESVKRTYDKDRNIELIVADKDYTKDASPSEIVQSYFPIGSNSDDTVQKFLKTHQKVIVYQPLFSRSAGKPFELCKNNVLAKSDCRQMVIYYVDYIDGEYKLVEFKKQR